MLEIAAVAVKQQISGWPIFRPASSATSAAMERSSATNQRELSQQIAVIHQMYIFITQTFIRISAWRGKILRWRTSLALQRKWLVFESKWREGIWLQRFIKRQLAVRRTEAVIGSSKSLDPENADFGSGWGDQVDQKTAWCHRTGNRFKEKELDPDYHITHQCRSSEKSAHGFLYGQGGSGHRIVKWRGKERFSITQAWQWMK